MGVTRYLADKSALARLHLPAVREELEPLITRALVGICGVTELEMLFSARNIQERSRMREQLAASLDHVDTPEDIWDQAAEIQEALTEKAQHRSASIPDLLVAATARARGLEILHYDRDFDTIVRYTEQPARWIVPPGTVLSLAVARCTPRAVGLGLFVLGSVPADDFLRDDEVFECDPYGFEQGALLGADRNPALRQFREIGDDGAGLEQTAAERDEDIPCFRERRGARLDHDGGLGGRVVVDFACSGLEGADRAHVREAAEEMSVKDRVRACRAGADDVSLRHDVRRSDPGVHALPAQLADECRRGLLTPSYDVDAVDRADGGHRGHVSAGLRAGAEYDEHVRVGRRQCAGRHRRRDQTSK